MMLTYSKLGNQGRLGNQLWQISSTIGIALEKGEQYGFTEWVYQQYFMNELPSVHEHAESLTGYLQDYRNFLAWQDTVFHYLQLKPFWPVRYKEKIFIHFRAYSDEGAKITRYHPEQDRRYYERAMSHFPDAEFVVFSDNVEKAKLRIPDNGKLIWAETYSDIEAFYQMTHCQGGIISNSSFAWWAGWLNGGKIVMPSGWYTMDAPYSSDGLYLPEWINT